MPSLLVAALAAGCSYLLVGFVRRWIIKHQMLDIPNERSSHTLPTPRGGGLAIVVVFTVGVVLCAVTQIISLRTALALGVGAFVALIGYLDDRHHVPPLHRAIGHFTAAVAGLTLLGGMPPLQIGAEVWHWGLFGHAIGVLGIVWMINLYNFMDGIDGIAASEALFVGVAASALMLMAGLNGLSGVALLLAAACLGFLVWNWPPARIFMGDVCSGFLGYALAVLAVASAGAGFNIWIWLILLGVFVVDSTLTLARRVLKGEKWYEAHRSHAYQHAASRFGSHLKVTLGVNALNLLWLVPLAAAAYAFPTHSVLLVLTAFLPLIALALVYQAGVNSR